MVVLPGFNAPVSGIFDWLYSSTGRPNPPRRKAPTMTDSPPDRLSNNPASPHHDAALLERGIGIRFKGVEKTNVEEYCVSEGWIRVSAGNAKDRYGNPLPIKVHGPVEPYFRQVEQQ